SRQPLTYEEGLAQMFFSTPLFHPTIIFNRKIFDAGDYFYKDNFYPAEDYELWTRILPKYRFANLKDALVLYRSSPSQVSNKKTSIQQNNTMDAKVGFINTMCGFMPVIEEKQALSDYFFCSSTKKLPATQMQV